jgi:PhoH-like ATPase
MLRFEEHEVVLPVVVITELEGKRHHPELGYFARSALRFLDGLRVQHGRLDTSIAIGERGGTIRVELNHTDAESLPAGFRLGDNDTRILAVARNLSLDGHDVTLVSKDVPLRVKASAVGLIAEEYRAELVNESGWTGMTEVETGAANLDALFDDGVVDLDEARELPCHTGMVLLSERGSALGRVGADKRVHLVRGDREAFGIRGRSAEQRIAMEMLLDPEVGIVSLGGRAGTGKSALALCAGLEAVMERRQHKKVVVFRRCSPSGARSSATCPAASRRRWRPGRRRCSTRSEPSPAPTSSTTYSTGACSRCCR